MAYEHENTVIAELVSAGMQYNSNAHYEMVDEIKEVYAKAKAFDEIVSFIREQYMRAIQNYGFVKYYGKSNEELKQAEKELLKIQEVATTICNALDISLEKFIILEDE